MTKVSETFISICPIDGSVCKPSTKELREYAAWLEKLAESKSTMLFSNGGIHWCPGACGESMRQQANGLICKETGIDPQQYLNAHGHQR